MLQETEVKILNDLYESKYNDYISSITNDENKTENIIDESVELIVKKNEPHYYFPDKLTENSYRGPIYLSGAIDSEYSAIVSKQQRSLFIMINYEDDKLCKSNDKIYLNIPNGFLEDKIVESLYIFNVNNQLVQCKIIFDHEKITICNGDGNFNENDKFGLNGYCVCLVCDY